MDALLKSGSRKLELRREEGAEGELRLPAFEPQLTAHQPLLSSLRELTGKIGIFGGTFDPVHIGHLSSAEHACRIAGLSAVVFVPTARNPQKMEGPIAGNFARLELLLGALSTEPNFFVSSVQLLGQVESYSIDLLKYVAQESPQAELYLIVGSDCLGALSRWKEVHTMLEMARLVVVERPGYPVPEGMKLEGFSEQEHAFIFGNVVRGVPHEVSSTQIRRELGLGLEPTDVLPSGVRALIKERGLYRAGDKLGYEASREGGRGSPSRSKFSNSTSSMSRSISPVV